MSLPPKITSFFVIHPTLINFSGYRIKTWYPQGPLLCPFGASDLSQADVLGSLRARKLRTEMDTSQNHLIFSFFQYLSDEENDLIGCYPFNIKSCSTYSLMMMHWHHLSRMVGLRPAVWYNICWCSSDLTFLLHYLATHHTGVKVKNRVVTLTSYSNVGVLHQYHY